MRDLQRLESDTNGLRFKKGIIINKWDISMGKKLEIEGRTFGHLKAIRNTGEKQGTTYLWEFECLLCGKKIVTRASFVLYGSITSCGCGRLKNLKTKKINEKLGQEFGTNISRISSKDVQKNTTSGHKGVSLQKRKRGRDHWIAYIYFQGQRYHLGCYLDINDAIKARELAEKKIFGDFLNWYAEAYPEKYRKFQKD